MNLEHEFAVPVPIDEAWRVLLDVERIAPCMPGATLTSVDGRDFTGSVKVKVGPITVTYDGKATFDEIDEAARRVVIAGIGKESRGAGTAAATVTATLVDQGASTTVRVQTDLNVTGRPAQFGRGVMAEVGAKLVGQFAACLADELGGAGAGAGAAAPVGNDGDVPTDDADEPPPMMAAPAKKTAPAKKAAPAKKTAAKKAAPGDPAPGDPGLGDPGPAKKAAAKKAAPAKKTAGPPPAPPLAAAPPPRPAAEPIDLLDVAGASVAKRVAPIAAGLVLLLLLRRRRRRTR